LAGKQGKSEGVISLESLSGGKKTGKNKRWGVGGKWLPVKYRKNRQELIPGRGKSSSRETGKGKERSRRGGGKEGTGKEKLETIPSQRSLEKCVYIRKKKEKKKEK